MRRAEHRLALLLALMMMSCLEPGAERARLDLSIGRATHEGARFEVKDGLAALRRFEGEVVELWLQAPQITLTITPAGADQAFTIEAHNAMGDAQLLVTSGAAEVQAAGMPDDWPTLRRWRVQAQGNGPLTLTLGPPDWEDRDAWRFGVLGDIQDAIDTFDEVIEVVNRQDIRFVLGVGDMTEQGAREQLERLQRELRAMRVPLYTPPGNHELGVAPGPWYELFGRGSFHFVYRGVHFTALDVGNASLAPQVYDWLDEWLDAGRDAVHVVAQHYPPVDPVGARSGSFRSRKEAAKLLRRLAASGVDLTLYGHIHSYYAFENAGIPAYITGGCGAIPEEFDGIARHFLVVTLDADDGVRDVGLVRVDCSRDDARG